ncbi:TolC family protein [Acidaminococcus timonensis]|uniref:TolC family protein n=1 Tax=Acidaminococcus timonensis TaxID=1871002 RepID=UPI003A5C5296
MKHFHTKSMILSAVILSALTLHTAGAAAPDTVNLDLGKAVRMALDNNSSVKISAAELDAAKAELDQAKGSRWGSIDFSHYSGRSENYQASVPVYDAVSKAIGTRGVHVANNSHTNTVNITVPIYTGGRLEGAIDQAKKNLDYYQYGMSSSYQTTRYNAEKGYYDVLQAANTVNLDKETVDRLNEHLKNTQAQFAVGVVTKADVLRSQVELVNAQQTLTQAENSYEVAVSSLNNVIGLPTATRLNLSQGLEYKPNDYTLDNCVTYAMVNRPEIHQAEASVGMAQAAEKIANAGNLPQVSLGASNQWSNDSFPGQNKNNWALGVTLTQNIWDYGVTAAKVREAKANIVKAQESYRQISDQVRLAVRTNYLSMREAEKRIKTTEVAVAQAEEDYRIAQLRYRAGVGTNTDVMDASVALTTAKNNYIQALYDYNTYTAALEQSMGVPVENE